jgi:hypothetical protein
VAGLVVIMVMQTGQWFFFDEWAFLRPGGSGLFTAHVGHWSAAPTLIYDTLINVFGLESYIPYALCVTVLHLSAAHLIWRIALLCKVNPWIAMTMTTVFVFLGSGSENILWAFQIGFVGALVFGLLAFLLAMTPKPSVGRFVAITALSLFSLTWSGTSLPLVAATAALLFARAGWRKATVYAGINALVYLAWYIPFALHAGPDTGGLALHKLFIAMPEFIGVMLIFGFGSVFPVPVVGFLLLLAVAVWIIVLLVKRRRIPHSLPAFILLGAAILFALLSAYSRAAMSVGSGRSSRYVYLIVLLLIPVLGLALSRLARDRTRWVAAISVALLLLAGYQGYVLGMSATEQSAIELGSQRLLSAALELHRQGVPGLNPDAIPDPRWAPDLSLRQLTELYDEGKIIIGPFSDSDLRQARSNLISN